METELIQPVEPSLILEIPQGLWKKVIVDFFEWGIKCWFLAVSLCYVLSLCYIWSLLISNSNW